MRRRRAKRPALSPGRIIYFTDSMLWDIGNFQRENGLTDMSEAVRLLISAGLSDMSAYASEEALLASIESMAPGTVKH